MTLLKTLYKPKFLRNWSRGSPLSIVYWNVHNDSKYYSRYKIHILKTELKYIKHLKTKSYLKSIMWLSLEYK